jgi:hypothetical protein
MASTTLAESGKLAQDFLVRGIIENIRTTNPFFSLFPFDGIDGNALSYNRENVLGDTQALGVNGTITAKAAATWTQVTDSLTTLIGDAEVNGLIQMTRSGMNDQTVSQINSKAKSLGRLYQNQMINGDGTGDNIDGLLNRLPASQIVTSLTANGDALSFVILDELMDLVKDKDGRCDYIMMPLRTRRAFYALARGAGGAGLVETISLPGGETSPAYNGTPILVNDWIPVNQTKGTGSDLTTIIAGTFDDGSRTHGIAGLTAANAAGIQVVDVGEMEAQDNRIWRIKWYCGLALFSNLGIAYADGITN